MPATRCTLVALLLLISTTFVQTKDIDIPFSDERVVVTPHSIDWGYWTYNETSTCAGIWTASQDERHQIHLDFTGVGITVHGYADPLEAPWRFKLDDEAPENLMVEANTTCKPIKDRQNLENRGHTVVVTFLSPAFVLTKFSVTQLGENSGTRRVIPRSLLFLLPFLIFALSSNV